MSAYFRFNKHVKKRLIFLSFIVILLVVFTITFYLIENNLGPSLIAIAEARAKTIATEAISEAISKNVTRNFTYENIIKVHKNDEDKINLIEVNIFETNKLMAETGLYMANTLKKIEMDRIPIPIGQITGSQILANIGPDINISIMPVGSVEIDIIDHFEGAGINQTRHKLYINVKTWIEIVVPLMSSKIEVSSKVPLAETIIVGDVPETMFSLGFNEFKDKLDYKF